MEKSLRPARRRALIIGITLGLLAFAWLGRESLLEVALAASAEVARLAAECSKA